MDRHRADRAAVPVALSVGEAASAIATAAAERARCYLARALDPGLRAALTAAIDDTVELPHVAGRTVVPTDVGEDDLVVVGWPNHLGCFDDVDGPGRRLVVADGAGASLEPLPADSDSVMLGRLVAVDEARVAREQTRLLVKRLRQLRGVRPAFMPASPIAIVLLPVDATQVAEAAALPPVTALSTDYPEFPGGLRIVVPPQMAREDLEAYAATLQTGVERAKG